MFFQLPLLAIDMGSSAIKMVELSGGQTKKLRSIGMELIPNGLIVDGIIQDTLAIEGFLKNLLKKLKIRNRKRRAAISLGGSSVIVKKVNFAKAEDPNELTNTIFYEAEQHFQHDIQDLYFDYYELPSAKEATEVPILLVGAKRDIVDQYMSVVKSCGLNIGVVDCGVTSLVNMFEYNYGLLEGLIAVVNVGANNTQVFLLGNGHYLYTREFTLGGLGYTKALSKKLGLSMENAESLKISASEGDGVEVQGDVRAVINETNDQLVNEIQMTLDYFFQSGEAPAEFTKMSAIFLCGGGARTLGLDIKISANLNLPVNMINPLHRVEIPKNFPISDIQEQSSLYGVCVGLGLRVFNDNVK